MTEIAGTMRSENVPHERMPVIERVGRFLFRHRSLTPIPLVLLLLLFARPSVATAMLAVPFWLAGTAIRLSALRFIGGASRSRMLVPDALVTKGPFDTVRNPLYVGNFLLTVGFVVFSGRWPFVLVPLFLFPIQYVPIVRAEETELSRRFSLAFQEYARRVPRWIPRRFGFLIACGDAPRTWGAAVRIERSTIRSVLALITALVLLRLWTGNH